MTLFSGSEGLAECTELNGYRHAADGQVFMILLVLVYIRCGVLFHFCIYVLRVDYHRDFTVFNLEFFIQKVVTYVDFKC